MATSNKTYDAIVVGAGLAGLKAALEMKAAGKSVMVLEARDRVGGRSMPGEICGQAVDFGGQWVGPQQKLLLAEARELGVATYPQYRKGKHLLSRNGAVTSYASDIPPLPVASLLEIGLVELRWKRQIKTLPADAPWAAARAKEWDAESAESWLLRNLRTSGARDFVRAVVGALTCAPTSQISYLYFLDTLRRGQGLRTMIDVVGGAQQDKFVGGAWQVPKRMAEKLGDSIVLNTPIHAIEQGADGVRVMTGNGDYKASRVIMTLPPGLASRIHYAPGLPPKRAALLQRFPMGAVIKVHVAYPKPFWRHRGLSGEVVSTERTLGVVFDQTMDDQGIGVLVGLIESQHAVSVSALSKDERRKHVIADLVHYFGEDAAQPLDYVDHDWISDEWSLGGYAAHMTPGVMTAYGDVLREPCGRIHWAGTETATEWSGYLDGALQSGIRAAAEVVRAS